MLTTTVWFLKEFCGRNADSFHNMEIALWCFPQYGKYNLNFPMKIFHYAEIMIPTKLEVNKIKQYISNRILYSVDIACPEITKITQFVMPKMSKITQNLFCKKCQKSCYFCGSILAKILHSRKLYEVFHVWLPISGWMKYPGSHRLNPFLT